MSKHNVISLEDRESNSDPLTELLQSGAKQLVLTAVEAEFQSFMEIYSGNQTESGHAAVVRRGQKGQTRFPRQKPSAVQQSRAIESDSFALFMRDRYFKEPGLNENDRRAFLWASYNAGPNKVRKLRKRASEMGLDPNRWFFNVEHAAHDIIGQETVRYVSNIYKYYIAYHLLAELSTDK